MVVRQVVEAPNMPTDRQLQNRGIRAYREVTDLSALHGIQDELYMEFGDAIGSDTGGQYNALNLISTRESATAMFAATRLGLPAGTKTILKALDEGVPDEVREPITSDVTSFSVRRRRAEGMFGFVLAHFEDGQTHHAQRQMATDIIDDTIGIPFAWRPYRASLVVGTIRTASATSAVNKLLPRDLFRIPLGQLTFNRRPNHYRRQTSRNG